MAAMAPEAQGVVQGEWKLVVDEQKVELFSLKEDPKEHHSRYAALREKADALRKHLDEWNAVAAKAVAAPHELTGDDVEALRALGYIE
jgi:hypothetical protein